MTAHTLALVLLRILAVKILVDTAAEIISQISMLRMMGPIFEEGGSESRFVFWVMVSIFVLCKVVLGVLLLVYSRKLADRIVGSNNEMLATHPQLATALTHVGVLLIGLSTLIYNLPRFMATTLQWFQVHASGSDNLASQQNGPMAQATLLIFIGLFLILRGKTLTRWLIRLSK